MPIRNILSDTLDDVFLIINVSLSIKSDFLYNVYGINVIDLHCGNLYILHHENYIFDKHNIIKQYVSNMNNNQCIMWTLPMYSYHTDYLNLMYNKEISVVPYVWDDDIIEKYTNDNNINITYKYNDEYGYSIAIFEPNISIHKTSLIPILIAERVFNLKKINNTI